tara:strand:- start:141 stop:752 length:612 start_codon:yes stop_codon:yes gene_type:complete
MATFKAQVEDLTGALSDDGAITQWLTDGARLVLDALPPGKLERITEKENFTTTTTSRGKRIFTVHRKDANNSSLYMPCRKLSANSLGQVENSSYMEYATTSDPAYIVHNNLIQTYPSSAASNDSMVLYVDTTITVAYGDDSIADLPSEAEQTVVLYAARNGLERLISDANVAEDTELVASLAEQYKALDAQFKEQLAILKGGV